MKYIGTRSTALTLAATFLSPMTCQAATAALPWDYTLSALQDTLITYIAPAAIGLALSASIVLYAIGEHDQKAGRLFGSGIGGLLALAVVYFLNYVAF